MPLTLDGPDDYWTRSTSPDRLHVWIVSAYDVKMSHWILGGALYRRDPEAKLFAAPAGWSFDTRTWLSTDALKLEGRRYPGRLPGITLTIDLRSATGTIVSDDLAALQRSGSFTGLSASEVPGAPRGSLPFDAIVRWLEAFPAT